MGNLLNKQEYYNYGDLFGDENIICNSIIENYRVGTMEEIIEDVIEKNIPDADTLYSKCAELEPHFKDAYSEEKFDGSEKSLYEILVVSYKEYIGTVLGFNFDDIIYNLCVEHANEILQEDDDLTYSEKELKEFLDESCFDKYTDINDIRDLLEEDINWTVEDSLKVINNEKELLKCDLDEEIIYKGTKYSVEEIHMSNIAKTVVLENSENNEYKTINIQ